MISKKFVVMFIFSLMFLHGSYGVKSAPPINAGEHIQIVTCSDNQHTYALYLPQSYSTTGKGFSVLFCFDAEGNGQGAVQQFMYAGVKYQWILVGSRDAKNGPWEPILQAQEAILNDVREKYHVNAKNFYAGGMSGGARMSYTIAYRHPKHFKGIIACGAGFGLGEINSNIAVYHCIGDKDSNYQEVLNAYNTLRSYNVNTRASVFPGGHTWPPTNVINQAIDWLASL